MRKVFNYIQIGDINEAIIYIAEQVKKLENTNSLGLKPNCFLFCTTCGNETPWRTLDINKQALCYSCSIKKL